MHNLHGLLCRLYPDFPAEPKGVLQVHIESGAEWIHIESDEIGVLSPYRTKAIRHLHVSGQYLDGEILRSAVMLFSIVAPPRDLFAWDRYQRDGLVSFDTNAWPSIWIPTAAASSIEVGPVRRAWAETKRGTRRSIANHSFCMALAREWDEKMGKQLITSQ